MAIMGLKVNHLQILKLQPWSFTLEAGEAIYLSGPSGSGKTRLLRAIADLDPHQGEIFLNGQSQTAMPANEWRKRVAFLPAESQWWDDQVGGHFRDYDADLLTQLGFKPEAMRWEVARLSSGEKQRLALLRALEESPEILLLDEPTANLDPQCTRVIETCIQNLRDDSKIAAIWVTHNSDQVKRVSSRGWVIDDDKLREHC